MPEKQAALGRRIAVVGTSGSGKTYVAEALAAKLDITYIGNDAIIWRPGWQETPHEDRVVEIDAATSADAWTFDGNLTPGNPDDRIVMERCDTIVWLDLPRWQVWSQVVRRTLVRIVSREELWHGNRESLWMLFSRESIVWWSVKTYSRRRREYAALFNDPSFANRTRIRLRSRGEVDGWLASVMTFGDDLMTC